MLQLVLTGAPVIAPPEKHTHFYNYHTASYHSKAYLYQNGYQYCFCFPVLDLIFKRLPSLKLVASSFHRSSPKSPCCLRFIHNGRKEIQSSNDGNVLSHLAKQNKGFTMGVPMFIGIPPKQNCSQSRFPSEVGFGNFCLAIPGL